MRSDLTVRETRILRQLIAALTTTDDPAVIDSLWADAEAELAAGKGYTGDRRIMLHRYATQGLAEIVRLLRRNESVDQAVRNLFADWAIVSRDT